MIDANLDGQTGENGAESEPRQQESEQKIARAKQYNFLMKLAAKLRHAGLSAEVIEVALLAANSSRCEEPPPREGSGNCRTHTYLEAEGGKSTTSRRPSSDCRKQSTVTRVIRRSFPRATESK